MSLVRRIARPLLSAIFVSGGYDSFSSPGSSAAKAAPLIRRLGAVGVPNDPEMVVRANGLVMAGSGLMLASGRLPRVAAAALAVTLVPTTLAAHSFWRESDPTLRAQQRTQFLKNLGLLGGVLLASVDTEGRPGLAYRAGMAGDAAERAVRTTRREARHLAKAARREAQLATLRARDAVG